jgi:4-diphosphocytidyl-2-C-methyl-D-erythritol kinase
MRISSPSKINLFLMVKGRRKDGYHDIESLLCRVTLFDVISLDFGGKGIRCFCSNPDVPDDGNNLAHQAAAIFFSRLKIEKPQWDTGVRIEIEKNIPIGAGLGGGSSNAASILLALNDYFENFFTNEELMRIGLSIGTDVPFFIFKNPAIATGIGEKLTAYKGLQPFKVLLVYPGTPVSTALVYKNLNLTLTNCEQKLNGLLFKNEAFSVKHHLCNDLEMATESMCPEISGIKSDLMANGAEGSLMTGSGSAVFGLFSYNETALKAFSRLSLNKNWRLFLADMMI